MTFLLLGLIKLKIIVIKQSINEVNEWLRYKMSSVEVLVRTLINFFPALCIFALTVTLLYYYNT